MGERKVLNVEKVNFGNEWSPTHILLWKDSDEKQTLPGLIMKYYPPDFFEGLKNLPKLKVPKDQHHVIRIMAPFTMRCLTCGEYIYKGRKFNARMEVAKGEDFLGLRRFRFYIRCPKCLTDITYKTDPENEDYAPEHGAVRTFQAERLAELEAERLKREREEEEANNPMKALESRTKESRHEMDVLDALEELKDLNARNAHVDYQQLLEKHLEHEKLELQKQEEEDEALVKQMFHGRGGDANTIRRLADDSDSDEEKNVPSKWEEPVTTKVTSTSQQNSMTTKQTPDSNIKTGNKRPLSSQEQQGVTEATDMLVQQSEVPSSSSSSTLSSSKLDINSLVKRKKPSQETPKVQPKNSSPSTECLVKIRNSSGAPSDKVVTNENRERSHVPHGLQLVGNYSDSSSDDNS